MMRASYIFAALGVALTAAMLGAGAGLAVAQQQPTGIPGSTGEPNGQVPPAAQSQPMTPVPGSGTAVVESRKLIGADVQDAGNEKIGDVSEVLVNTDGHVSGIVVSVGDFLGIADRKVVFPWNQLRFSSQGSDLVVVASTTKDSLKAMPAYDDRASWAKGSAATPDQGSSRSSTHDKSRPIRPVPSE